MPAVELCFECSKEIDVAAEKYVVVSEANKGKGTPRVIAHVECLQKHNRGI